ncbi:MAG: AraC family transcriptional regulator [Myxococcota bacterium]
MFNPRADRTLAVPSAQTRVRQPTVVEARELAWARLTLQELVPGSYRFPARPTYRLTVPIEIDCRVSTKDSPDCPPCALLPSQLLLTGPGVTTTRSFDGPARCLEVEFDADRIEAVAKAQEPSFSGFGRGWGEPWRAQDARDAVLTLWRQALSGRASEQDVLSTIVADLLKAREADEMAHRRRALSGPVRRRVVAHIEENLQSSLKLAELAEVAKLSPFHFARAFRHDLGLPPRAYVLERRLARAREAIETTQDRLDSISYRVGFSSQQHMTATFRQRHGITPGALRRHGH